jgi:hypothetical protein
MAEENNSPGTSAAKLPMTEGVWIFRRAWWHGFSAVQSDEKFVVWLRGPRRGLEYREGDHVMRMGLETASPPDVDWIVYLWPCRWIPPYENESITDDKCAQIQRRVVTALDFLKVKCVKIHLA